MAQVTTKKLRELEAWARVRLSMPRAEFRALTLAEWNEVAAAYRAKLEDDEFTLGRLRLTIAQAAGAKKKNGADLTLAEFYQTPEQREKAEKAKTKRQKKPDTYQQFMAIFGKKVVKPNG